MTYTLVIVECHIKNLKYSTLKLHKLLNKITIFQEVEKKGTLIYHKS
jgi:hypothetical protein